jgi:hypothetical protein
MIHSLPVVVLLGVDDTLLGRDRLVIDLKRRLSETSLLIRQLNFPGAISRDDDSA